MPSGNFSKTAKTVYTFVKDAPQNAYNSIKNLLFGAFSAISAVFGGITKYYKDYKKNVADNTQIQELTNTKTTLEEYNRRYNSLLEKCTNDPKRCETLQVPIKTFTDAINEIDTEIYKIRNKTNQTGGTKRHR
jgi:5-bromo-4-chloroindolyl phosphate hydrolysis protein